MGAVLPSRGAAVREFCALDFSADVWLLVDEWTIWGQCKVREDRCELCEIFLCDNKLKKSKFYFLIYQMFWIHSKRIILNCNCRWFCLCLIDNVNLIVLFFFQSIIELKAKNKHNLSILPVSLHNTSTLSNRQNVCMETRLHIVFMPRNHLSKCINELLELKRHRFLSKPLFHTKKRRFHLVQAWILVLYSWVSNQVF